MSAKEIDNVKIRIHTTHVNVTHKNKRRINYKQHMFAQRKRKFTKHYNGNHTNIVTLPAYDIDVTSTYVLFDYKSWK